jgi:hypothetical protein
VWPRWCVGGLSDDVLKRHYGGEAGSRFALLSNGLSEICGDNPAVIADPFPRSIWPRRRRRTVST